MGDETFYFAVTYDDVIELHIVQFADKDDFDWVKEIDETVFFTEIFEDRMKLKMPDYLNEEGENFFAAYDQTMSKDQIIADLTNIGFVYNQSIIEAANG